MATEQRVRRVTEEIKREVAQILQKEIKDPRLGFVTVTSVDVSRDLRHVKIYYSHFGNEEERKTSCEALKSAEGFVRKEIGRRLKLRYTPEIIFIFDESFEHADHISRLLNELNKR